MNNLQRWFKEEWKDEKGNPCGSSKNKKIKKCRPTKKISKSTPVTWGEMSHDEKEKAINEKKKVGMGKRTTSIKHSPMKNDKIFNPYTQRYVKIDGIAAKKYNLVKQDQSPMKKNRTHRKWSDETKKKINCNIYQKGFSQRAYCQGLKKKQSMSATKTKYKTYFDNYDLYSDANPKDTVRIKYTTLDELKQTIKKLENLFKKKEKPHKRIVQIANVIKQRLRVINTNTGKGRQRFNLINRYFDFLKERTQKKNFDERKKLNFSLTNGYDSKKPTMSPHSKIKDDCYYKVKSRYRVWPSAYASGALSKCRKVGAKNWGNKTKKRTKKTKL